MRRGYSLRVSKADPPPVSSMAAGKPLRFGLSRTTSPYRGGFGRCAPCRPTGSPPKPSASGFGGERRRKEVNGAFRPKGGNRVHGLFDDAGDVGCADRGVNAAVGYTANPYAASPRILSEILPTFYSSFPLPCAVLQNFRSRPLRSCKSFGNTVK